MSGLSYFEVVRVEGRCAMSEAIRDFPSGVRILRFAGGLGGVPIWYVGCGYSVCSRG